MCHSSFFFFFHEVISFFFFFFFSSRRRHTRSDRDWSSDVCSSDLIHHIARLPIKADAKATTVSVVQARSANVAPVTTMDSPSAMMMNPAQRSAMWPPSTTQSSIEDAPYFGIQNRTAGEIYSMPSATSQSSSRECPSARPPAIQKMADIDSHAVIRTAFMRAKVREDGVDTHRKTVLPTCIAA